MLNKLQKRVSRPVGPALAPPLEPVGNRRNVAGLSLFYRYYFCRCSSELTELVPLPYSCEKSTRYSDRYHDFLPPFLDVIKMSMSAVSFVAQLDSRIL